MSNHYWIIVFKSHFYYAQEENLDMAFLINWKHYKVHPWLLLHKLLSSKVCQKIQRKILLLSPIWGIAGLWEALQTSQKWMVIPGHEDIGAWNGVSAWVGRRITPSFPCSLCVFLASSQYQSLQDIGSVYHSLNMPKWTSPSLKQS